MFAQILWGSLVLGICTLVHLAMVISWANILRKFRYSEFGHGQIFAQFMIVGMTLVMIIAAHTVQVWFWAFSLMILGAVSSLSDAIYFALVTYTTVGYGDVTLGPEFRIFGAMASVTGLLGFGISTAFLVELLSRLFTKHLN